MLFFSLALSFFAKLEFFRWITTSLIHFYFYRHNCINVAPALTPCKQGDAECVKDATNFVLKNLYTGELPSHTSNRDLASRMVSSHRILFIGFPAIHLAAIDPLIINKITLKQGAESPVNVELNFNNVELTGLKDHTCYLVK